MYDKVRAGNPQEKELPVRPGHTWEDIIKIENFMEIEWASVCSFICLRKGMAIANKVRNRGFCTINKFDNLAPLQGLRST
jgi:hypothetical protein